MAGTGMMRRRAAVLAAALALDLAFGEPPPRLHPVVWIGRGVAALDRRAPQRGTARQLSWGGAVAGSVPVLAALAAVAVERTARRPGRPGLLLEALALKSTFAVRALLDAGGAVRRALGDGEENLARAALRSLVSRDTDGLSPSLLAAAAIESLAENTTDSFIAPWLAYAVAGLPGAAAYRAVNTLDSMLGYRGRYEYLGKAPARLDDLLNLIPARASAAALVLVAAPAGGSFRGALRVMWRDRARTASPNAGWTMAAMAGALGVRLEKRGAYVLGGDGREPTASDVRRAQQMVGATAGAAMLACMVAAVVARWRDASR